MRRGNCTTIIATIVIFMSLISGVRGQESPIIPLPVEIMAGHERAFFQLNMAKPIGHSPLGFFNVTSFQSRYDNEYIQDFVSVSLLYYEIGRGFSPAIGFAMNQATGFQPFAGMQHVFVNENWLTVIVPGFYLSGSQPMETFALVEHRSALNDQWAWYQRLQGLYVHSFKNEEFVRGYLYARFGLTHGEVNFGIGVNFDYYGGGAHGTISETNIGPFVRVSLF